MRVKATIEFEIDSNMDYGLDSASSFTEDKSKEALDRWQIRFYDFMSAYQEAHNQEVQVVES